MGFVPQKKQTKYKILLIQVQKTGSYRTNINKNRDKVNQTPRKVFVENEKRQFGLK